MERHVKNVQRVAEFLESHSKVQWVTYSGLPSHPDHERAKKYLPKGVGAMMGFGVKGGKEAVRVSLTTFNYSAMLQILAT